MGFYTGLMCYVDTYDLWSLDFYFVLFLHQNDKTSTRFPLAITTPIDCFYRFEGIC